MFIKLVKGYILLVLLCSSTVIWAQKRQVEQADELFNNFAYVEAIDIYEKLAKGGQFNNYIGEQLAEAYRRIGDTEQAEYWYSMVVEIAGVDPINYYHYAMALRSNKKYQEAEVWLAKYAEENKTDSRPRRELVTTQLSDLTIMLADSNSVNIAKLNINSEHLDFSPCYYGEQIVFVSNRPKEAGLFEMLYSWDKLPFLDLYMCDKGAAGQLGNPRLFSDELNSKYHEGPVTFDKRLRTIYFSRSNIVDSKLAKSRDKTNNIKIFSASLIGTTWSNIQEFGFNSDEYSCEHPTLTPDGKRLFFASDMPGGYGNFDLYMCKRINGAWSEPINLGKRINTEGNEVFPFVHQDSILYFASDGLPGFGGLDAFYTQLSADTVTIMVNMGYPINSSKDDFGLIIDNMLENGYFSSNREGGKGMDDIYAFSAVSDEWLVTDLLSFATPEPVDTPSVTFDGKEVVLGEPIVLKNIYYDLDKWNIRPDAEIELKKVIKFMIDYPEVTIELSSHTDSRASWSYNIKLSQRRAESATNYIVENGGIGKRRIVAKGYGETLLVNECADDVECTEEQHQLNRRTEITVLTK